MYIYIYIYTHIHIPNIYHILIPIYPHICSMYTQYILHIGNQGTSDNMGSWPHGPFKYLNIYEQPINICEQKTYQHVQHTYQHM